MNARCAYDFSQMQAIDGTAGLRTFEISVAMGDKTLLHPASAHFAAGQVTAILGPNGAGKSTLMSVLTGQRKAGQGKVEINGQSLQTCARAELARLRAFVAQETQVAFDFSVQEVVDLGRYPHRKHPSAHEGDITLAAMQSTRVEHLSERALNTLSGGEKARVHLARALAQVWESTGTVAGKGIKTRWLLLDEPTAALDLQHQHRMLQLARNWATVEGVGVVAVLHDLNLALRYSDYCVVLQHGHIVASGQTHEVLTPACIAQVWEVEAHPVKTPNSGLLQYIFGG